MTRTTGTPGVIREFIGLASPTARRAGAGGHPCQGLYHRGVGRKPKVAMIATHYQIDFSEHYLADYMATRGIGFLGWNTRFRGFESSFLLDHALVDIGVGIRWLRDTQCVETVVLLGNSGGGSLMAAYQAQAVAPNVVPLPGMRPAAGLGDLLPADGYVASAAHPGRPDVLTAWMDPAVVDENDAVATDPELDLFDRAKRTTVLAGVPDPLPVSADRTQQHDHRLGRERAETCSGGRFFGSALHGDADLGRSPDGRSDHRADQTPAEHVLCRTSGQGQPFRAWHRGRVHAAQLDGHVESADRADQGRATFGTNHMPCPGDQRRGRHRCLPIGCSAHLRRAGQRRQIVVRHQHRPLLHHARGAQRAGRHDCQMDCQTVALRVLAHFVPGPRVLDFVAPEADWLDIRWCSTDDSPESQATFCRELPHAEVIWHMLRPLSGDDLSRATRLRLVPG